MSGKEWSICAEFPAPLNRARTADLHLLEIERLMERVKDGNSMLADLDPLTGSTYLDLGLSGQVAGFYAMCRSATEIASKEAARRGLRGAKGPYSYFALISDETNTEMNQIRTYRHSALHDGSDLYVVDRAAIADALAIHANPEAQIEYEATTRLAFAPLIDHLLATEQLLLTFYLDMATKRTANELDDASAADYARRERILWEAWSAPPTQCPPHSACDAAHGEPLDQALIWLAPGGGKDRMAEGAS